MTFYNNCFLVKLPKQILSLLIYRYVTTDKGCANINKLLTGLQLEYFLLTKTKQTYEQTL